MKLRLTDIFILLVFLLSTAGLHAQTGKKQKLNKKTSKREIKKIQEEASNKNKDFNAFNPLQPMGASEDLERDDIFWGSETGNTVYINAGNISLLTPSRYGIKQDLEISTVLAFDFLTPNVMIKKRWKNDRLKIATRHGLYSATPGLHWLQNNGLDNFGCVDSTDDIPMIISLRNEVFFSYVFYQDVKCIHRQPFLILTLNLGIDGGIPIGNSTLEECEAHFLTNRSPALLGQGVTGFAKARLDGKLYDYLYIATSMNFFYGSFKNDFAFENHTSLQTFISKNFSVSVGFYVSFAAYNNVASKAGILPFFDLSWYFGKKESRQKGLFNKQMF
jgi:hypothetical protein